MKRYGRLFAIAALLLALPAMAVLAAPEEPGQGALAAMADRDGDGIPDVVERKRWYRNRGGSPRHKDIWVECDYMRGLKPDPRVRRELKKAFAAAPGMKNPAGKPGINLHLTSDDQFAFQKQWGNVRTNAGYRQTRNKMLDRRRKSFDGAPFSGPRAAIMKKYMHYCVFVNAIDPNGISGISMDTTKLLGGIPGDIFIVSLGLWTPKGGHYMDQVGTVMHELGHNLGLRHGGNDHTNYKPNYHSVMNYFYQSGFYREFRPAACGGGQPCAKRVPAWDYSRFRANNLNERRLRERAGVRTPLAIARRFVGLQVCPTDGRRYYFRYNKPANWNCDRQISAGAIAADINGDDRLTNLGQGQNNWANIVFDGGAIAGPGSSMISEHLDPETELDWETRQQLPDVLDGHAH